METTAEKKKSYLGTIGWVLFVIGMILLFSGLGFFIIYGPIFLATFIIAIILMTRRQVGSGIALLLLTLILPPISWFGVMVNEVGNAFEEIEQENLAETQDKMQNIEFEDIKVFTRGGYMYCEGKVRNTGNTSLDFVKVKVEWLDKNNKIVDTDYTYAVSSEGLEPYEAKSFSIMSPSDPEMTNARYYVSE